MATVKNTKMLVLAAAGVLTVPFMAASPAAAAATDDDRSAHVVVAAPVVAPVAAEEGDVFETKAGPLLIPVVVWAIGCAASGLISAGGTDWNNPDQVAWGVAGIVVGCLPGVAVGSVVKVILAHKGAVATALKAIGLTAPAAVLCGSSAC